MNDFRELTLDKLIGVARDLKGRIKVKPPQKAPAKLQLSGGP